MPGEVGRLVQPNHRAVGVLQLWHDGHHVGRARGSGARRHGRHGRQLGAGALSKVRW